MFRIGLREIVEVAKVIAAGNLTRAGDPARRHLREVERFEEELARKLGVRYALCLSGGGTAALVCGLVGMGIGPGDEVIVPAYTWIATAAAVLSVGAVPVLAEVDETLTIDPADVEAKLGPATRAIVPVHMRGRPADLGRVTAIARSRGVRLLEDVCQAAGGSYRGRRLGAWGDAGAFSFNHYKIIACGEGGALVTNDRTIFERALVYHDNAMAFRHAALRQLEVAPFLGGQLRASEIMGAVLRVQLSRLDGILGDLRRARGEGEAAVGGEGAVRVAPSHDREGDCGVVLAIRFPSEAAARRFAAQGGGYLPIDSERHVYANWEPILERRIGHHPDVNPLDHEKNRGLRTRIAKDACPRTLDVLARTVLVELSPDWSRRERARRVARWRMAAAEARANGVPPETIARATAEPRRPAPAAMLGVSK